ncbi:MAG: hypothetical protein ABI680_00265 [Chthoniobacteraceae bacterium]
MNDFNTLFPNFLSQAQQLRTLLLPVAFIFLAVGIISSTISGHRSPSAYLRTIGRSFAVVAVLVFLPTWGDEISQITDSTVKNTLNADPTTVYAKYNSALAIQKSGSANKSWWDKIWSADAAIFEALVSWALWLLGLLASVIVFYAFLVQKFVLYIGYALSPIFVGFIAVRGLQRVGLDYITGLVGVMLWPLGWGVASLMTNGLIDFMADQSFLQVVGGPLGNQGYSLQGLIGLGALAIWLIFSTIAAPVLLQRAIARGTQVGSDLASGAATSAGAAVTAGASAANAASIAGGGGAASLALGGAAATTAVAGTAMSGGQYSPMASLLGDLGRSATPPGNEKSDSGGGGEGSLTTAPPDSERYNHQDPANDAKAQQMVEQAKAGGEAKA